MPEKIIKREDQIKRVDLHQQLYMDPSIDLPLGTTNQKVIHQDTYQASQAAQEVLVEAKEEASKVITHAKELLSRVEEEREKARKEGFETGKQEGLYEITRLLVEARRQKEKTFEGLEAQMVKMVYDIAEKIIGQDLSEREETIVGLIRQALHTAHGQNILILVNPADLEVVKKNQPLLMQALDTSKIIQVRGDEKVARYGCLVETEIGTVDAQLKTQLAAIREALGIEEESEK